MDDEDTLTAYHEAGHAVIAYALGGIVDAIQLGGEFDDRRPARFGETRVEWGKVDPACDWQRQREVMTYLAGPVAEMIYRGEPLHPAHFIPWSNDWARAMSICEPIVADPMRRTQLLERIIMQLHPSMREEPYWSAIAALADELLAHDFLEEEQVTEVMGFWIR